MSQHFFTTVAVIRAVSDEQNMPVKVTLGYDRPLDGFFMVIENLSSGEFPWLEEDDGDEDDEDDGILYSNLFEAESHPQTLERFRQVLGEFSIELPPAMIDEVECDFIDRVGNRAVRHSLVDGAHVRELLY